MVAQPLRGISLDETWNQLGLAIKSHPKAFSAVMVAARKDRTLTMTDMANAMRTAGIRRHDERFGNFFASEIGQMESLTSNFVEGMTLNGRQVAAKYKPFIEFLGLTPAEVIQRMKEAA
ncbi:MAG: hypothetical protein ACK5V0_06380 [Alphaproteobacteria bacterium]